MPFTTARQTATAVFAALTLSLAGCGSATPLGATADHASAAAATGNIPSESARMVCQPEAENEIAAALGARTSQPPTPTWADHLYSCRYTYPNATMVVSVKELPDDATTSAYYAAAQNSVPGRTTVEILGQNGFAAPDGSISVRKDLKVLRVDVSALPDQFGMPAHTRADVAFAVAAIILGCWTGS
jgi:predicted small lipoprotein YifL